MNVFGILLWYEEVELKSMKINYVLIKFTQNRRLNSLQLNYSVILTR
jgi:hypothetical protein